MRVLALIVLFLVCLPVQASLDRKEIAYRAARSVWGLTDGGEAWLRAICQIESGSSGRRCGHENSQQDQEILSNPCIPKEGQDEAQTTRAFVRAMQVYIFDRNEWTTKDFNQFFAEWYHAGGAGKTSEQRKLGNASYRRSLLSEYRRIRAHIAFRNQTTGYQSDQPLQSQP